MGCTGCSTKDGVPAGCKSNGSCGTGGCEKMSVYDWLTDIALPGGQKPFDIIEVSFKNGRKHFYKNTKNSGVFVGETIVVEGNPGHDVGVVTLTGELVKHQMNRKGISLNSKDIKKVYRKASEADLEIAKAARDMEYETMHEARKMASSLGLQMKLGDVEYQGDKTKATFYYTAEDRVDFRELIKVMADKFRIRIEMRQIGARQEAGRLGGIGACGRELCCSTWLTDFRTVSTSAARYQQLSLNPQKLAGQCGKLKCCLNFELDQYMESLASFPSTKIVLETEQGKGHHIKTDVFRRMMWYLINKKEGMNTIVPLSVDKVNEIIQLNKSGKTPQDLKDFVEIPEVEVEPDYENVVGQDDLTRFDKNFKKNKSRKGGQRKKGGNHQQNQSKAQQPNQPQAKGNSPVSQERKKSPNDNKTTSQSTQKEDGQGKKPYKGNKRKFNKPKPNKDTNA